MFGLFKKKNDTPRDVEQELQSLERQAKAAAPGYETHFWNRAGDLCVDSGQEKRALKYYGLAIDAYMESGRFSAADIACHKLLRIAPDAVRTRCTLAWLSIGNGHPSEAAREVEAYISSAVKGGQQELAVKQLRMMGEATLSTDLQERIAHHLLELWDDEGANTIFGEVFAQRNGRKYEGLDDEHLLWERLLRAALMSPGEMLQHEDHERSAPAA